MNTQDRLLNQSDFVLARSKSSSNGSRSRSGSFKRSRPPVFDANSPQLPQNTANFPQAPGPNYPPAGLQNGTSVKPSIIKGSAQPQPPLHLRNGEPAPAHPSAVIPQRSRTLPTKKSHQQDLQRQLPPGQLPQLALNQPGFAGAGQDQTQQQLQQPYLYHTTPQVAHQMAAQLHPQHIQGPQSSPQQQFFRTLPQKHPMYDDTLAGSTNQPFNNSAIPSLARSKSAGFSLRKNKSFMRGNRSQAASPNAAKQSPMLPNMPLAIDANSGGSSPPSRHANRPVECNANASPSSAQRTPMSQKLAYDNVNLGDENASRPVNPFDRILDEQRTDDLTSLSSSLKLSSIQGQQQQQRPYNAPSRQQLQRQPSQPRPKLHTGKDATFESLLIAIVNNKKINKAKFKCDPNAQYDIKLASSWVEYYNLKPQQYTKIDKKSLQRQEIVFQLIKYQQLNSKNDKKDFWDTIGYDFLFSQDESIVFPETKAEVYDDFFGYFNTLQQLEDLCEKHLYNPLMEELNRNRESLGNSAEDGSTSFGVGVPGSSTQSASRKSLRLFNINNICMVVNTWLFKIIETYQLYINQLIVTKFWLEMEYFKDPKSNVFLNWLNNNFKSKFPYQDLISNYLINNLRNYVTCFQKLLKLHSHKKSSTTYKKILIIVNSLKTFVSQCHGHYSNSEFKNFLSRFNWSCVTNGNIEFKWKNLKIINHNKINSSSNTIDYLILFNNCLILCKLDIYLKEFIVKEYPLPIEFLDIMDLHPNGDELTLLHRGKAGLKYTLKFFNRNLKQYWVDLITDTKVDYLMSKSKIDPFEMIPVSTNFLNNDSSSSIYHNNNYNNNGGMNGDKKLGKLQQCENVLILMALDNLNRSLKNTDKISGKILCSLTMNYNNQTYHLIGTNFGLYIDDINRTGLNWKKLSGIRNVKQVEFIERTSKLIVFTGDQLVQFDFNNIIKSILDSNYHLVGHDISNNKVFFFKMSYVNGELYLFYRYLPATIKKKGLEINNLASNNTTSHFKILKLNRRMEFEVFKGFELKDINCYDVVLLNDTNNMIYLSTDQGFFKLFLGDTGMASNGFYDNESLNNFSSRLGDFSSRITLVKLQIIPSYVYNSENNYSLDERMFLQKIEENLKNSKPIKILETSNPNELLLTYQTFAIFINRHTDLISRFDIIHFNLNVENIAFKDNSLFACSKSCIEVFKVNNNKSITMFNHLDQPQNAEAENLTSRHNKYLSHEQVIVGHNINLIDSSSSSITIVLDHPLEAPGHQLVMQLLEKKKQTRKSAKNSPQTARNDLEQISDEENDDFDDESSDSETSGDDFDDDSDSSDDDYDDDEDSDEYAKKKRRSQVKIKEKKLTLDKMKIMDSNTRLPAKWTALWDLTSNDLVRINSNFIERQELIYQLLKNEENLIFQAKKLHRTLGFKFLSSEVHENMIYPDTKDSIYRHTFGCLNPLVSFHEKYLLKPMLEILNLKSKNIPLYDILDLYASWIGEANFIYLEYTSRLVKSDWFFELENRKETSNFLSWLNFDYKQLKETLEIFFRNLHFLVGHFNLIIKNIKKNRDIDSKIEITKIDGIIHQISTLNESINSKLNAEKFTVITEYLNWDVNADSSESSLIKKSFLSSCTKKLMKLDEIFLKVNEGQNKIYKKKRLIMLFPNWLLITKFYKDKKLFQVIEKPLAINKIKFDYSTSDHNSINIYNFDGKILYKLSFPNRNVKKEWFDAFTECS